MSETDALWDRIRDAFKAHQIPGIDHTPQMALDRIAVKWIRLSFNSSNCDVHEEVLSLNDLRRLERYSEDDPSPHCDVEPIVVLAFEGHRFVIDGRRRVTKWLEEGVDRPRSALIIEPRDDLGRALLHIMSVI